MDIRHPVDEQFDVNDKDWNGKKMFDKEMERIFKKVKGYLVQYMEERFFLNFIFFLRN